MKNERNVKNIQYVFVTKFHIRLENFSDNWNNSFIVTALNFFRKRYFRKCKKILKKLKCVEKN